MYQKITVPIPQIKGKIITKKKGDEAYILYQYGQKYNAEKKYAVPQRVIIGKADTNNPQLMYPNERFEEYFPDAHVPEELPETYRSCSLRLGSHAVIQKVMNEYKLPAMLTKHFPTDYGLLMDLVSFLLVDEENAGQYYPDYAFNHPLFSKNMHIYSDSKVSRFLNSVTKEQIIGFLDDWNRKRDHKQRIYVSYDSTNKNCQAGNIDILEYGKPKDSKGVPIYNLAVAFDKTNSTPLFYEEYPGSINDVAQFKYVVDKIREYKYKSMGFILDRGYFSKDNIKYIENNGYSFIMMVKGCKKLVASIVAEHRNTFETDRECSIRSYRVYGKTVVSKLYEDDTRDRYMHLFFSPSRQAAEREQLEQTVDRLATTIEKHIGTSLVFGQTATDLFNINYDKNKVIVSFSEKKEVIKQRLELCGYFCIVTSEKMTAAQALIQYKGRDISEKLFSADKSFLGSKSARVQSDAALSAKIFIEFIALIVRNRIYNLLKETLLRLEGKPNYMSVPAALRELEKIEMVRRNNGQYRLDHAVTKKQRIILSSFGLDDEYIRLLAETIGKQLAELKENHTDEEDADDGTYQDYVFD